MDNPLVSVIVPVYRVEDYLNQCIASIAGQTYTDLEILLLDDGSPDGCGAICDCWAEKDSRIRVIHKENSGVSDTRNLGIRLSTGAYLLLVDSDDYLEADAVESLVGCAREHQAQCVLAGYQRLQQDGRRIPHPCTDQMLLCTDQEQIQENILRRLIGAECKGISSVGPSACTKLYERRAVLASGAQFLNILDIGSEDLYFNLCFFQKASSAVLLPTMPYVYRDNQASCTNTYHPERLESFLRLYQRLKDTPLLADTQAYGQMLAATVLGGISVCVKLLVSSSSKHILAELHTILRKPEIRQILQRCQICSIRFPLNLFCILMKYRAKYTLFVLIKLFVLLQR